MTDGKLQWYLLAFLIPDEYVFIFFIMVEFPGFFGCITTIQGSPYKSMQVDFYQRVSGTGVTNKNLQVNAT